MFLCDFTGGGEDLQHLLGFLVREQLQHDLLIGSSSGRALLSLMLCSSFIYSFFFHCGYGSIETHSMYVTHHPLHVRRLLYIVPCVRCRTSLTWTGWCSKDGRRWWRAAVPAPRRQIMTKLMVWILRDPAAHKQQLQMRNLDVNTAITTSSLSHKFTEVQITALSVLHQSVFFSTQPRPFLESPN